MGNPEKFNPEQETNSDNNILDLNYVYYLQELGRPIVAADLIGKTIVIDPSQFEEIVYLDIIDSEGEFVTIDLTSNISGLPLIINPEDLFVRKLAEQSQSGSSEYGEPLDRSLPTAEVAINELVSLSLNPVSEMKDKISRGDYKCLIGDDASGRLSTLLWRDFLNRINSENDGEPVDTYFLAGSRFIDFEERQEKIKDLTEYLKSLNLESKLENKNDTVLITTDTIQTGQSLVPLTQALGNLGIKYEIMTNVLFEETPQYMLEANLGCKIHYGELRNNDIAPKTYGDMTISGVTKDSKDLFARRINIKGLYGVSSHDVLSESRKLVPAAGQKLVDYYHSVKK